MSNEFSVSVLRTPARRALEEQSASRAASAGTSKRPNFGRLGYFFFLAAFFFAGFLAAFLAGLAAAFYFAGFLAGALFSPTFSSTVAAASATSPAASFTTSATFWKAPFDFFLAIADSF
jgi:hypothetical protein